MEAPWGVFGTLRHAMIPTDLRFFRKSAAQETLGGWQPVGVHWNGEVFARSGKGAPDVRGTLKPSVG